MKHAGIVTAVALATAIISLPLAPALGQQGGLQPFSETAVAEPPVPSQAPVQAPPRTTLPPPQPAQPAPPEEEERSIAPWVLGGVILGGGIVAAVSLSDDDDGGSSRPPPPSDGGGSDCTESDVLGTWTATIVTSDATITRTITINDGGSATFQEVTDPNDPGPSASASGDGTWELDGCTLTLDSPIATMDGSAVVSGSTFTLQSTVYHR